MDDNRTLRKWLFRLLIVHIISLTYSGLTHLVNFGEANDWLKLVIHAGILFCMIPLGKSQQLYRITAVILGVELACSLLRMGFNTHAVMQKLYEMMEMDTFRFMTDVNNVFHIVLSVCGFSAIVSEYIGHSRVVKPVDLRLSKWWIGVMAVTLVLSVAMSVLSSILMAMIQNETLNYNLYQQIQPFLSLPGLLVKIFYMICLFKSGQVLAQVKDPTG